LARREKMTSPIVMFTYNRPDHTRRVVESLRGNPEAKSCLLRIYSDGAREEADLPKVLEVREYLSTLTGFGEIAVVERERNFGLASNIIDGVGQMLHSFGTAIVVEDDILVAPCFLGYMNSGLEIYRHDHKVASIHGYNYPLGFLPFRTYFLRGADCWGWATWSRAWARFEADGKKLLSALLDRGLQRKFDFDGSYPYTEMLRDQIAGKNQSWAVRWYASAFVNDMYTLYPARSLVDNIGFDGTGQHCEKQEEKAPISFPRNIRVRRRKIVESKLARQLMIRHFRGPWNFRRWIGAKSRQLKQLARTFRPGGTG
jgi:hypothetical protein